MKKVVAATGTSQANTGTFDYQAFGHIFRSILGAFYINLFAGQYGYLFFNAAAVPMYYTQERWYDPTSGTWLSRDPIGFDGGDWNLYRYVGNEPVGRVDPGGLACIKVLFPGQIDYGHAWIEFNVRPCDGQMSAGFWPNPDCTGASSINDYPGNVCMPDPNRSGGTCDNPPINSWKFETALCDCINASRAHHRQFSADPLPGKFYVCGSWAHQMWRCAWSSLSRPEPGFQFQPYPGMAPEPL